MEKHTSFISIDPSLVCRLHKALNGLKQALRQWFEKLKNTLVQLGFKNSKCAPSLFTYSHNSIFAYFLVYMDDIVLTVNSPKFLHYITQ